MIQGRAARSGIPLLLALLLLGACDAESSSLRPEDDQSVLPGSGMRGDAGTNIDAGTSPTAPVQQVRGGAGVGVGTVAGGVLMRSERYQLFGATGQSPGNEITGSSGRFQLRSGVVGVTP